MVTLKIERQSKVGFPPAVKVYLDGNQTKFNYILSRDLTRTTNESADGIFTEYIGSCYEVTFSRGSASVNVQFEEPWDIDGKNASQIMEDIVKRVELVNRAFEAKYTAVEDISVREF